MRSPARHPRNPGYGRAAETESAPRPQRQAGPRPTASRNIRRIALAFEAGRDGFRLDLWRLSPRAIDTVPLGRAQTGPNDGQKLRRDPARRSPGCGLACEQPAVLDPVQRQIECCQTRRAELDGFNSASGCTLTMIVFSSTTTFSTSARTTPTRSLGGRPSATARRLARPREAVDAARERCHAAA